MSLPQQLNGFARLTFEIFCPKFLHGARYAYFPSSHSSSRNKKNEELKVWTFEWKSMIKKPGYSSVPVFDDGTKFDGSEIYGTF